jgi:hypothetical protein
MSSEVEYKPSKRIAELDDTKPLALLVGESFVIDNVEFWETSKYTIAKVSVKGRGSYRTTSEVIVKQLKEIKERILDKGKAARVTLLKRGRYLTFG